MHSWRARDRVEIQTAGHRHPGGKLELGAVGSSCERVQSAGKQPETTRATLTARWALRGAAFAGRQSCSRGLIGRLRSFRVSRGPSVRIYMEVGISHPPFPITAHLARA